MEAIPNCEFSTWHRNNGIEFDARFPDARSLVYESGREFSRFWTAPDDPGTWPTFIATLLTALDSWSIGFLWPRSGHWPLSIHSTSDNAGVRDTVIRGAGIPDGYPGAIGFPRREGNAIVSVMFASLALACDSDDDLFFLPNHGRQFLHVSHHCIIHLHCSNEQRLMGIVLDMAEAGYPLPTDVPDPTLKRPSWMPAEEPR
jgi:hypothetical protein